MLVNYVKQLRYDLGVISETCCNLAEKKLGQEADSFKDEFEPKAKMSGYLI